MTSLLAKVGLKKVVSISLGPASRDKQVEIELLGQRVLIRREGMDGDEARAMARFTELDGKVDAFGVGGISLHVQVGNRRYPLYGAHKLVRKVRHTPVVDGCGLKNTLEKQVVRTIIDELGINYQSGRVLLTAAIERPGMTQAFFESDYEIVCGDLMFGLGMQIPIRTYKQLKQLAYLMMPIVSYLPIRMLYPTGQRQEEIIPRFQQWYDWATVIAGDCHYIKHHMPNDLSGKIIVTNTTTESDIELFRQRGIRILVTTTPVFQGRSFGTNLMEAALIAVSGKNRPLTHEEIETLLLQLGLKPTIMELS